MQEGGEGSRLKRGGDGRRQRERMEKESIKIGEKGRRAGRVWRTNGAAWRWRRCPRPCPAAAAVPRNGVIAHPERNFTRMDSRAHLQSDKGGLMCFCFFSFLFTFYLFSAFLFFITFLLLFFFYLFSASFCSFSFLFFFIYFML